MAVHDELEAILARLQRMREELRLDVAATGEAVSAETSGTEVSRDGAARRGNDSIAEESLVSDGSADHDGA